MTNLFHDLLDIFQRQFYVVYNETFKNENSNTYLQRFMAKHSALKPKFIVVNDQIEGIKKYSKRSMDLEKFPVFCEIEYEIEDNHYHVLQFDLTCECLFSIQESLSDVMFLLKAFSSSVSLQRHFIVDQYSSESILITSKLADFINEQDYDFEIDLDHNREMYRSLIESRLAAFSEFISLMEALLIQKKALAELIDLC